MLNVSKHNPVDDLTKGIMSSSEVLNTPKAAKVLRYWLTGFCILFFVVLFLPWQQNITAEGSVTALTPQDRPQTVESAIAGRIRKWYVREGQTVRKGDTVLTLDEIKEKYFDPELLTRLAEQIQGKEDGIRSYEAKMANYQNQIGALEQALVLLLSQQQNKIRQTRAKIVSDSADFEAEKNQFAFVRRQEEVGKDQYDKGLMSLIAYESRKAKFQETNAKVVSLENKLIQSRQELLNARLELTVKQAEYREKIAKAQSDLNASRASVADGQTELAKLRNERANMAIRNDQYVLRAPQDGMVVKALKAGIGETIKEQEAVVTIMPANPSVAVELYVKPMDVPLLSIGREVRLEFDGWPALQFSGWPNVAVGTFGGTISVIDAVDSKEGKYRLLVSPKPGDDPWPVQLRQGSSVYGWAMLDDVPIWYEIWRQLNGFPASLKEAPEEGKATGDASKTKK
jgi:membrane fusion protein, adhesin transport system